MPVTLAPYISKERDYLLANGNASILIFFGDGEAFEVKPEAEALRLAQNLIASLEKSLDLTCGILVEGEDTAYSFADPETVEWEVKEGVGRPIIGIFIERKFS